MKQRWNNDKCRCECKEFIDRSKYSRLLWNSGICECECDKSCDAGKYLIMQIVNAEKNWLIN